jgi:hypothetical protein
VKKYRNKLNHPLPITLNTESISVGGKKYFDIGLEDESSPGLVQALNKGHAEFIEETVVVSSSKPAVKKVKKPVPVYVETSMEEEKDKDGGDILTETKKMVKSEDEEIVDKASSINVGSKKKKKSKKFSSRG